MKSRNAFIVAAFGLLGVVSALWSYFPALSSYLAFDDFPHIASLYSALQSAGPLALWEAIWSSDSGPTGRPVAMATLVAQVALPGGGPAQLKWLNLAIHLGVGAVLFRLAFFLFSSRSSRTGNNARLPPAMLAAAVALIWLVHPLNLGSVAYTVQRMNSLSALFVLLALVTYIRMRLMSPDVKGILSHVGAIALFWMLGVYSKENAVLLPLFIMLLEWLVVRHMAPGLPFLPKDGKGIAVLASLSTLVLVVVGVLAWLYFDGRYGGRAFDIGERVLTEGRVLIWYLQMLLFPDVGQMGLYHDDWTISRSFFEPLSTLLSWVTLLGLALIAIVLRHRLPLVSLGLLWFFAGHLLESTVVPLELVFEHRNYLPGMGIVVAVVSLLAYALERLPGRQVALATVTAAICVPLAVATHARAERWADDPTVRLAHLESRQASQRAQIEAAQIHAELATQVKSKQAAERHLARAESLFARVSSDFPASPDPIFGWILFRTRQAEGNVVPLYEQLERRMQADDRVRKTAGNGIHALRMCVVRGPCDRQAYLVVKLINLSLTLPSNGPGAEARLFRDKAHLLFATGQHDAALAAMKDAVERLDNDVETRIDYAVLLARAGRSDAALEQVKLAEALDRWNHKVQTLRYLRSAIIAGRLEQPPIEEKPMEEGITRGG